MADTVNVICRLPSGTKIELYDLEAVKSQNSSGVVAGASHAPHVSVTLNGIGSDPRFVRAVNMQKCLGGRTKLDKAVWEAWIKHNASSPLVKNNIIFAEPTESRALDRLASEGPTSTGLEPLDQEKLPGVKPVGKK